jgi:uncharacterized membrane protein YkvA (DUF1232 family)
MFNFKKKFDFNKGKKTPLKTFLVAAGGVLSALYLVYPSMGIFEFIPDSVPFIGSVDEFTAAMMLLAALNYFGFDLIAKITGEEKVDPKPPAKDEPRYEAPEGK